MQVCCANERFAEPAGSLTRPFITLFEDAAAGTVFYDAQSPQCRVLTRSVLARNSEFILSLRIRTEKFINRWTESKYMCVVGMWVRLPGGPIFAFQRCGLPLYRLGSRPLGEWEAESRAHGWPSFRDSEVVWENVREARRGALRSRGSQRGAGRPRGARVHLRDPPRAQPPGQQGHEARARGSSYVPSRES